MRNSKSLASRYTKLKLFYCQHTDRNWQHALVGNLMLASTVAFLLIIIGYGMTYLLTDSSHAGVRLFDFAVAKVFITALYVCSIKKGWHFAGPLLVAFYLILEIALVAHGGIDAAVLVILFITTLITGALYGGWCSLVPASVGAAILLGFFSFELQSIHTNTPQTSLGTLLVHIAGSYVTGLFGAIWHSHQARRPSTEYARSEKGASETILFTHDLIVDTQKRQATRAGVTIALRRKEYDILEYLIRHKGQVATKDMIFENIWHKNIRADSLSVHMKHLRDKIDKPFDTQLIETAHGVGYTVKDLPRRLQKVI